MCLTLPLSAPQHGGLLADSVPRLCSHPLPAHAHTQRTHPTHCAWAADAAQGLSCPLLSSSSTDVSWTCPLPISARTSWKVGAGVPAGDFLQEREARAEKRREEPRTQSEGTWGCPLEVPGLAECDGVAQPGNYPLTPLCSLGQGTAWRSPPAGVGLWAPGNPRPGSSHGCNGGRPLPALSPSPSSKCLSSSLCHPGPPALYRRAHTWERPRGGTGWLQGPSCLPIRGLSAQARPARAPGDSKC